MLPRESFAIVTLVQEGVFFIFPEEVVGEILSIPIFQANEMSPFRQCQRHDCKLRSLLSPKTWRGLESDPGSMLFGKGRQGLMSGIEALAASTQLQGHRVWQRSKEFSW
jgi:hypothetical protein